MTDYYVRADGTAANKDAAMGPSTQAASCMNMAVFKGETFLAGDTVYFSSRGGNFTEQLTITSSGSVGSKINYIGEVGFIPTIDVSASTSSAAGIYFVDKNYINIIGFDIKGSGGAGSFMGYGTSGTAGDGFTIFADEINVLDGRGTGTSSGNSDGFSFGDTAQVALGTITALYCTDYDGSKNGSHQAVTTHGSAQVTIQSVTAQYCNYVSVPVGTSSVIMNEANFQNIYINAFEPNESGSITVSGGTMLVDDTGGLASSGSTSPANTVEISGADIVISAGKNNYARSNCMINIHGNNISFAGTPNTSLFAFGGIIKYNDNVIDLADMGVALLRMDNAGSSLQINRNRWSNGQSGKYPIYLANGSMDFVSNVLIDTDALTEFILVVDADADGTVIVGNTIYNSSLGGRFINNNYGIGSAMTINDNVFYNVSNVFDGTTTNLTIEANNYYNSQDLGGAGSITSDPLFNNAAIGDLSLQPSSPCIGAGAVVSGIHDQPTLTTDVNGVGVHFVPNIGAYDGRTSKKLTEAYAPTGYELRGTEDDPATIIINGQNCDLSGLTNDEYVTLKVKTGDPIPIAQGNNQTLKTSGGGGGGGSFGFGF